MRSLIPFALMLSACAIHGYAQESTQTPAQPVTRAIATSPAPAPVEDVSCLAEPQRAEYERRRSELFKSAFNSTPAPTTPPGGASAETCAQQVKSGDLHHASACMAEAIVDAKMPATPSGQVAKAAMRNVIAQMRDFHLGVQKLRAEYPPCPASSTDKSTK